MQLRLVHTDNALRQQMDFLETCRSAGAQEAHAEDIGGFIRLWGKEAPLALLRQRLKERLQENGSGPVVTFMGSGDFHHVSALLIEPLAQEREQLTVVHFDNHPDWVRFDGGMHCGSWVNRALALPGVARVVTVGPCSRDLCRPQFKGANLAAVADGRIVLLPWRSPSRAYRRDDMHSLRPQDMVERLKESIPTRRLYITIDKDVMTPRDAITNWDQGQMPLECVLHILKALLHDYRVAGIDITGDYSPPRFQGKKRDVWLKTAEALLDQRQPAWRAYAASVNQRSNLALLHCIREAA